MSTEPTTTPAVQQNNAIAKKEKTHSERFTDMVVNEFSGKVGELALTAFQKRLIQNYFISIDQALRTAEERRSKKKEGFGKDPMPVEWKNINMELLATNVVACARIGFDPACANHINMVPYKNNNLQKYDIVFVEGYRGKELKAKKYGFDVPDDVVVELVYHNDKFTPIKKDQAHSTESYIFTLPENCFDRGPIVGGFYYFNYFETPQKNKVMFYSKANIEKRKPEHASAEFWGGIKDKWENDPKTGVGKKVGTEKLEGWYDEMMWKTMSRMAYSNITIDSQKIDDDFIKLSLNERLAGDLIPDGDFKSPEDANSQTIDIDSVDVTGDKEPDKTEPITTPEKKTENTANLKQPEINF